jgi:hypothetical protein
VLSLSGCSRLKPVKAGVLGFDEFSAIDCKIFVKDFSQLLGQNDGDRARIASVNRNLESAGVSVVAVDVTFGLPYAISMTSRMIVVTDQENLGPKVLIERVLSFDCGEIITGRDHATVKDDELIFTRGQKNSLLWAATEGDAGEEDGGVVGDLRERQELHETGARRRSIVVIDFIEQPRLDVKLYFSSLEKNYTRSAGFGAAGVNSPGPGSMWRHTFSPKGEDLDPAAASSGP